MLALPSRLPTCVAWSGRFQRGRGGRGRAALILLPPPPPPPYRREEPTGGRSLCYGRAPPPPPIMAAYLPRTTTQRVRRPNRRRLFSCVHCGAARLFLDYFHPWPWRAVVFSTNLSLSLSLLLPFRLPAPYTTPLITSYMAGRRAKHASLCAIQAVPIMDSPTSLPLPLPPPTQKKSCQDRLACSPTASPNHPQAFSPGRRHLSGTPSFTTPPPTRLARETGSTRQTGQVGRCDGGYVRG